MRLHIRNHILARAGERPPGYAEDVLARGRVEGEWLELSEGAYAALLLKYRAAGLRGAGDVAALVAKPAAAVIDFFLGTDLANCGRCKERQAAWNEKFPLPGPDWFTDY